MTCLLVVKVRVVDIYVECLEQCLVPQCWKGAFAVILTIISAIPPTAATTNYVSFERLSLIVCKTLRNFECSPYSLHTSGIQPVCTYWTPIALLDLKCTYANRQLNSLTLYPVDLKGQPVILYRHILYNPLDRWPFSLWTTRFPFWFVLDILFYVFK